MSALTPISGVGSVGLEGPGSGGGGNGVRPGRGGWVAMGLLWSGRGCAALLAIFWGLFFVEHVGAWYLDPKGWPPAWVTAAMAAHALVILGLAAMLRWSRLGIALTIVSTIGFIALTLVGAKPAWIMLVNLVPVALVAMGALIAARRPR